MDGGADQLALPVGDLDRGVLGERVEALRCEAGVHALQVQAVTRRLPDGRADAQELEPGGETTISVLVTDANGQPVPDTELAVVVVDEAYYEFSQATMARMMRIPVSPVMSVTTWCSCTFICMSAFCMC